METLITCILSNQYHRLFQCYDCCNNAQGKISIQGLNLKILVNFRRSSALIILHKHTFNFILIYLPLLCTNASDDFIFIFFRHLLMAASKDLLSLVQCFNLPQVNLVPNIIYFCFRSQVLRMKIIQLILFCLRHTFIVDQLICFGIAILIVQVIQLRICLLVFESKGLLPTLRLVS